MVHEFCQENRIPLPESLRQEDLLEKRILLTNSVDDFLTLACQLCEEVMDKLLDALREQYDYCGRSPTHRAYMISLTYRALRRRMNTSPETVRVDRTNGAAKPLKWCKVTAAMVH